MFKYIAFILSFLFLFISSGCGQKEKYDKAETGLYRMDVEDSYKYTIPQLGEDVMPVSVYVGPMPEHGNGFDIVESQINDKYYKLLKEAGVNFVYGHSENGVEDIYDNLDLCEKYGLAYLLRTDHMDFFKDTGEGILCYPDYSLEEQARVKNAFIAKIKPFADHPAFAGIKFSDEVGIDCFPGLAAATEIFNEEFPNKMIYHNLLGDQASNQMLETAPYFQYYPDVKDEQLKKFGYDYHILQFTEQVPVKYISFDNYPILLGNVKPTWVRNISRVANLANEKGIAFWNFIQACDYGEEVALPTEAQMLWQNNISLAYGAKGLQMFTFFCPVDFLSMDLNNEAEFCIDSNGNITDYYYSVKNSLVQVSMVDEVLMNSKWKGMMVTQTGFPTNEIMQTDTIDKFNHLESVQSTNASVVVGCFNYQGKTALYVVNNSVISPTNVTLNFNVGTKGYCIKDCNKYEFTSKNKQLIIPYLVAGGAALVVID